MQGPAEPKHRVLLRLQNVVELARPVGGAQARQGQDPQRLGYQSAELLFDRINGETGPPRRVVLPVKLIVRGSGELPPP